MVAPAQNVPALGLWSMSEDLSSSMPVISGLIVSNSAKGFPKYSYIYIHQYLYTYIYLFTSIYSLYSFNKRVKFINPDFFSSKLKKPFVTTPRSSAGIGVRNWHCRISLAKHRSAAPRHQMITARNKKRSTKKPLGEKFMFPKGSGDWALVKLLKPFRGAYEYGSVATLRCHIGYQRVTWRVILGNGFR